MVQYDKAQLHAAIIRSYGCTEKEALLNANYVKNLDERLQSVLDAWISDGTILEHTVYGINCRIIMSKLKTDFLSSLSHFNRFIQNPSEAERFLRIPIYIMDAPRGGAGNA